MTEMHSDRRIYADMVGRVSEEEIAKVEKLTLAWADATEAIGDVELRIVFLACVNAIGTMGPAYCKLAAINLMKRAQNHDPEIN